MFSLHSSRQVLRRTAGAVGAADVSSRAAPAHLKGVGELIDCAITGSTSGHIIGLHRHASHVHALPITWGLTAFIANGAAWRAPAPAHRELLLRELSVLEHAAWEEARRETAEGLPCKAGAGACTAGRPGELRLVPASREDRDGIDQLFRVRVLERQVQRCGQACLQAWNSTLAAATGVMVGP